MDIEDLHGMQLPGAALINNTQIVVMICWSCGEVPSVITLEVYAPTRGLKVSCAACGGGIQVIDPPQTGHFLANLPELLREFRENTAELEDRRRRRASEYMGELLCTLRSRKLKPNKETP